MSLGIAVVSALALALCLGLIAESGQLVNAQRDLYAVADAAAAAGAEQVDVAGLHTSGGQSLAIDPTLGRGEAEAVLAAAGISTYTVTVSAAEVTVAATREVDSVFVSMFGIDRLPVSVAVRAGYEAEE